MTETAMPRTANSVNSCDKPPAENKQATPEERTYVYVCMCLVCCKRKVPEGKKATFWFPCCLVELREDYEREYSEEETEFDCECC